MLWKMFARLPGATEDYATICVEEGMIAMGWDDIGTLSSFSDKDGIKAALQNAYPDDSTRTIGSAAACLWSFANDLDVGHIIVCPDRDDNLYYIGSVDSLYYHVPNPADDCPFTNRRKVDWLMTLRKDEIVSIFHSANFGSPKTLSRIHEGREDLLRYLNLVKSKQRERRSSGKPQRPDPEWGRLAELRALAWLRNRGYEPDDVAHMSRGWDIECAGLKYEVKGRKTHRTRIILTNNEFTKARQYQDNYALLIFTARTPTELSQATPEEFVNPANTLEWEQQPSYILNERQTGA